MHLIHGFCVGHARAASTDALTDTVAPPAPVFLCDGTEFFLREFYSIIETEIALLSSDISSTGVPHQFNRITVWVT
jgi:hypothetical protein